MPPLTMLFEPNFDSAFKVLNDTVANSDFVTRNFDPLALNILGDVIGKTRRYTDDPEEVIQKSSPYTVNVTVRDGTLMTPDLERSMEMFVSNKLMGGAFKTISSAYLIESIRDARKVPKDDPVSRGAHHEKILRAGLVYEFALATETATQRVTAYSIATVRPEFLGQAYAGLIDEKLAQS